MHKEARKIPTVNKRRLESAIPACSADVSNDPWLSTGDHLGHRRLHLTVPAEENVFRISHSVHVFFVVRQAASRFVAQIGTDVFVANHFGWMLTIDGSVIGSNYQSLSQSLRFLDDFKQ